MIFLNTNVVSKPVRLKSDARVMLWLSELKEPPHLSTVSLGEIAFGILRLKPDARSKRLQSFLSETRKRFQGRIHVFDEESALIYGGIMGNALRAGFNIAVPDGMIAAIALRHGAAIALRHGATLATLPILRIWALPYSILRSKAVASALAALQTSCYSRIKLCPHRSDNHL